MTVFDQDLVHQCPNLLAHGMTQIVGVQHPLEQFSLCSALAPGLLKFLAQPENVRLERLPFAALE